MSSTSALIPFRVAASCFPRTSAYFDDGGHLGVYLNNGVLTARIQSTSQSYTATASEPIETGERYHVAVTFGSSGFNVYLNGTLATSLSYTGGITGNQEPIVLGANQWASGNFVADKLFDAFDGELTTFRVYDTALTATQVEILYQASQGDPTNTAPTVLDETATTNEDQAVTIDVLANDNDPDGDSLAIAFASATNGSVTINPDNTLTYEGTPNYNGTDVITYTVADGRGGLVEGQTVVTITPVDDAPVASDATFSLASAAEPNDPVGQVSTSDADGDALSFTITAGDDNGIFAISNTGLITVANPAALDPQTTPTYALTVNVTDATQSATATVTVNVVDVAIPPPALLFGPATFDGTVADAQVLAHESAFASPEATLEFRFTADALNGRRFLFSKDSAYYDDGGHIGVYLDKGFLTVRLQSTSATYIVKAATAVTTGTDHHVAVTLGGPGGLTLYLDGQVVDTDAYTGGLTGNGEPIVIGANQWASGDLVADKIQDPFLGEISRVAFYNTSLDATQVEFLYTQSGTTDPVNQAPVALDDSATVDEDTAIVIDVLANDSDPDGDPLTIVSASASNGTVSINPDGTLTYEATADFFGSDSIDYTISDGADGTDSATVQVTVTNAPDAPLANPDVAATDAVTPITIDVLGNDTDADGDPLEVTGFTTPSGGSLTLGANGIFTYTPNPGFTGIDSFDYTISDGLASSTASVNIEVDQPVGGNGFQSDDFNTVTLGEQWNFQGIAGSANVATNATDAYLEIVSPAGVAVDAYNALTAPRLMQAVSDGDFQISARLLNEPVTKYQEHGLLLVQDESNWIRFDLAYNADGLSLIVGLIENNARSLPVLMTVASGAVEYLRATRTGDTFAFDYSSDGTTWTNATTFTTSVTPGEIGVFAGSTSFTATPPGFTSQIDFVISAENPIADEDGNAFPPSAQDDLLDTGFDTALTIDLANDLLSNDSGGNGTALTLDSFTQPENGNLVDIGGGQLVYSPNTGFSGTDTFTYTVSDGSLTSSPAKVSIVVAPQPGTTFVSDDFSELTLAPYWSLEGPAATADLAVAGDERFIELNVPAGNYDVYNQNNGTRLLQSAADEDFAIEARFLSEPTARYQLQGLLIEQDLNNWLRFDVYHDGASARIFAARTVNANSTPLFNTAIASAAAASHLKVDRIGDDWTFSYSADGNTWTTAGQTTHAMAVSAVGPFAGATGGSTPGHTAQVDYFFNLASPIVDEDSLNAPPTPADDTLSATLDTALTIDVTTDLIANDTDPDGDGLTLASFTQPQNGILTETTPGELTYQPDAGFVGIDAFDYTVTDGAATAAATVSISVSDPTNTPPVAVDDTVVTDEDTPVAILALANDTDADTDPLTFLSLGTPSRGTVAIDDNATPLDPTDDLIIYTPNANENGADAFTYTITDGRGGIATATVDVSITTVNDVPVPADDILFANVNVPLVFDAATLVANDTDAENDPLTATAYTQPLNGTLVDDGNGVWTYTPNAGFTGTDTFTYTVTDGSAAATGSVSVNVGSPIDVWYGDYQDFSVNGTTQKWVNILGNVDTSQVTSLSYRLNGGSQLALNLGPDLRRLEKDGDFNIDIDVADLDGTTADDVVTIIADLASGASISRDVTIAYDDSVTWAANDTIDWSTFTAVTDAVQVVDGLWELTGDGVRPLETGYDRVIAIGDRTWDNYEVRFDMTVHDLDASDPVGQNGAGLGFGMLWNGHSNKPSLTSQPLGGFYDTAYFFSLRDTEVELRTYDDFYNILDEAPLLYEEDKTYEFRIAVEQVNVFDRQYSFKVWEAGTPEPVDWLAQGTEAFASPVTGSLAFIVHYWDFTLGNVEVNEITGNDIAQGSSGDDILSAVEAGALLPGLDEIDVLIGAAGNDIFELGSNGIVYYDDGNALSDGRTDYALIWDFESGSDTIRLAGDATDYLLVSTPTGAYGQTEIHTFNAGEQDELIAIINGDIPDLLTSSDFSYDVPI